MRKFWKQIWENFKKISKKLVNFEKTYNKIWLIYWNVILFLERISRNVGNIETISRKR